MKLKSLPILTPLLFLAPSFAFAAPITAMSCASQTTRSFVTIGISTELFAQAAPMRILAYDLVVGKLGKNGEVVSKIEYANESNMKVFDDNAAAAAWVSKNLVVVPIVDGDRTKGAVLVDAAKKKVTIVDADYETTETLDCLEN